MPKFKPKKPYTLYKPGSHYGHMSKNSQFISRQVAQHIEIGGVPINVYRLLGTHAQDRDELGVKHDQDGSTEEATDIRSFMGLQDVVLGENRDRSYDFDEIPVLKGAYTVSQNELEYLRFGAALANDIITMEFHAPSMEERLGRRIIVGDVVELEHLREVGVDGRVANKWYEISGITWSPAGYDPMYARHVLGCTMRPLRHQQEFLEFFEREDQYGKTLADQASNLDSMMGVTERIQELAGEHAYTTGSDTTYMWIDPNDPDSGPNMATDSGIPPNGIPLSSGVEFPANASDGDWFLRDDLARLYRFDGKRWRIKQIDRKRDWQPYNWTEKLREFMSDGSVEDNERKYELRSIHDVNTAREKRSDPTGNTDR